MAERRMFAKTIIDSDAFLDMPITARLLYYDLSMRADDDGFVNSPKKIMRMVGASQDDLSILILRKFILPFDNGIVVIKHWRIHNYIRKDTYNETPYTDEMAMLELDSNKAYKFKSDIDCIPSVDDPSTQVRLGKVSIDKDSIDKNKYIVEIVDYLNLVCGTNYGAKTKNTVKHINARLDEGFTVDDFKTVIDKKAKHWLGNHMEQYLRPDTLFGTKFESYLNQNIVDEEPKSAYMESIKNRINVVDEWV